MGREQPCLSMRGGANPWNRGLAAGRGRRKIQTHEAPLWLAQTRPRATKIHDQLFTYLRVFVHVYRQYCSAVGKAFILILFELSGGGMGWGAVASSNVSARCHGRGMYVWTRGRNEMKVCCLGPFRKSYKLTPHRHYVDYCLRNTYIC